MQFRKNPHILSYLLSRWSIIVNFCFTKLYYVDSYVCTIFSDYNFWFSYDFIPLYYVISEEDIQYHPIKNDQKFFKTIELKFFLNSLKYHDA